MAEPQKHLDPLSALDAAFLFQERPNAQMHIGGVAIFQGPPPDWDDFLEHVRVRLDRVPRYRQKLAEPPLGLGRRRWIDDPSFNLEYHVLHKALPSPGDERALRRLVGRIYSQRLDRAKPLWELLLIEGLRDDRFAILTKTHHSVVDGISGVDITAALFDVDARRRPRRTRGSRSWVAQPEPSPAELAAMSVNGTLRDVRELPLRAAGALGDRLRLRQRGAGRRRGRDDACCAPRRRRRSTSRSARTGAWRSCPRSWRTSSASRTSSAAPSTTSSSRSRPARSASWMHARGLKTEGIELRAGVPVSTRVSEEHGDLGNRLTQLIAPLPVGDPGPGRAAAHDPGRDDRAEGDPSGARRRDHRRRAGLRSADDPRPVDAPELLHARVQRARHEHPRPAAAALPARPRSSRRSTRSRSSPATAPPRSPSCPTTAWRASA